MPLSVDVVLVEALVSLDLVSGLLVLSEELLLSLLSSNKGPWSIAVSMVNRLTSFHRARSKNRLTSLAGIAKDMPSSSVAIFTVTPMTSPLRFATMPPDEPVLILASVCM